MPKEKGKEVCTLNNQRTGKKQSQKITHLRKGQQITNGVFVNG